MLISVIVPIYNVEKYIKKCIDSIVCQSYDNLEIILVDDGSSDACVWIVDDYAKKDDRIKVIHKKNGGLVSARQAGLIASKGEYVFYVDGDDWICENCIEKFYSVVSLYDVDLVCCSALYYMKNRIVEHKIPYRIGLYEKKDLLADIYPSLIESPKAKSFPSSAWGKFFRREKLVPHQMNVDRCIVMGEDLAFTKPYIASISSMYIINDCLYCYNCLNVESITHAKKCLSWKGPAMISSVLKENLPLDEYDFTPQINRYLTHSLFNVAVSQFNSGKKYREVSFEIRTQIKKKEFSRAIKDSSFRCWSGFLAKYSLLLDLNFLIFLYWKKKFNH